MKQQTASAYCPECKEQVRITRINNTNHFVHFLMTILTCGLWIIFWVLFSLEWEPWKCDQCGANLGGQYLGEFPKPQNFKQ